VALQNGVDIAGKIAGDAAKKKVEFFKVHTSDGVEMTAGW